VFDLGFLKVHAPELARLFSYRMIDVCGFQIRAGHLGRPKYTVKQTHRALADCLNEIEELKHYESTAS
jgi:oligoribonuclease (3'-5' exoribonuclease)